MDVAAAEQKLELLIQYLKDQHFIKDYTYLAPAALLTYDYLLTIYLEVILVWFSPWTYAKALFLLARYIPIAASYLLIYEQLGIDINPYLCSKTRIASTWLIVAGIVAAETILMIRVWAVWRRDLRIGLFLVAILVGTIVSASVNVNYFLNSLSLTTPPYHGFRGCFSSNEAKSLLQAFTTLAFMDAVVLGMMTVSAFRAYRSSNKSELWNVVHRDAILFYVCLLICSISSAVVTQVLSGTLMDILTPLQNALHSILACRIVFNIRSVAIRAQTGATIGLHSDYREMRVGLCQNRVDGDCDRNIMLIGRENGPGCNV